MSRSLERIATVAEQVLAEHREAKREERAGHRVEPRPVTALMFLLAVPQTGEFFKPVPDEYVNDGAVRCLCGRSHALEEGELRREDCGRWFLRGRELVTCYREPELEREAA